MLVAMVFKTALLGPDHSRRMFLTIDSQIVFGIVLFVAAVFWKSPVRVLLASSALGLSLAWLYVAAVNATV
jgi:hypothetical protein